MMIRTRYTFAAVTVAAALALAGCGGGSDGDKASDPETSPPAAATTDASASETPAEGASGSSGASGLADALSKSITEGKSAHVTMEMGTQGTGEGDMSFDSGKPAMQLTMKVAGQTTQMRLVDGVVYIGAPTQAGKFMKVDAAQASSLASLDPSKALDELEKVSGNAKDLGDGHWQLSQSGATTDVWVGDNGYLDKVSVSGTAAGAITMTYSDWGKKVDVKAPSAGDIVTMPGAATP